MRKGAEKKEKKEKQGRQKGVNNDGMKNECRKET